MKNDSKWIGLLLDSSGFIVINKALIKVIGTDASLMVGELVSEYNYYEKTGNLTNKEWFYSTQENITENTGLTRYAQDESIKKLIELKILETKVMGMPSKKYYKIEFKNLEKLLKSAKKSLKLKVAENNKQGCRKQQTRLLKTTNKVTKNSKQVSQKQQSRLLKSTTNNNNNKNKKKNNKTNLILSREDEIRNANRFNSFYKNTDIDSILEENPSYIDIAENVYNIANNIYKSNKDYEIISGNKITLDNLKETLDSYDKTKMKYVLESLFFNNSNNKIQKLDKYIIATLFNAPRTYALYKSNKANMDFQKIVDEKDKYKNTFLDYDFNTFK